MSAKVTIRAPGDLLQLGNGKPPSRKRTFRPGLLLIDLSSVFLSCGLEQLVLAPGSLLPGGLTPSQEVHGLLFIHVLRVDQLGEFSLVFRVVGLIHIFGLGYEGAILMCLFLEKGGLAGLEDGLSIDIDDLQSLSHTLIVSSSFQENPKVLGRLLAEVGALSVRQEAERIGQRLEIERDSSLRRAPSYRAARIVRLLSLSSRSPARTSRIPSICSQ